MPLFRVLAALLLLPVCVAVPVAAATGSSTDPVYRTPPQALVDIVDAPPTPDVDVDPRREWLLLLERPNLPPISELAERELRLAGLRIRPRTSGPSRTRYFTGLELLRVADGSRRRITGLPTGARIENIRWSPDGSRLAFTHTGQEAIELWVAEVATGQARRLGDARLNLVARTVPVWLRDGRGLVATLVPADRGAEPSVSQVPTGPVIQESLGRTAPARTYQDLLKSASDEALFEHYLTSQLARIDLDGRVTPLGAPGLLDRFSTSPDGRYLLTETLHRPFSYLVPASRFPRRIEVWDLATGQRVREIADVPLQDEVSTQFDAVPKGPRQLEWRADAPATLVWAEALDGGNPSAPAEHRDRIVALAAPFVGDPVILATLPLRYSGVSWGNGDTALVRDRWWKDRRIRTWRIRPDSPTSAPDLLFDRSSEDRYSDPGVPVMVENEAGRHVMLLAGGGKTLYLTGDGASPEGDRPFLDAYDLTTRKARRLFRSEAPFYEDPLLPLPSRDNAVRELLVRRESVMEPPNYFVRDLRTGKLRQLTSFPHPMPQLAGLQKELVRYKRDDGVQLTATLYLPPGYKPADGPLPLLMWAYPEEFKSADAASQVQDSPYRFDRVAPGSPLVWLAAGYAVLDNPTMPIVGAGDAEPNDTYVEQLVASARAAVDEMVRRGVADPRRIAISGHSYGAFMTANLLAHSDLFAAGIARSGAYNRTLTPFGFQAEERLLWKASETYLRMSPFMYADKINEPILLIHGQVDNNSGTDPIQSERFYSALKGQGATTRLVMLPGESHGYAARESLLHMLWETHSWLERYVKNRPAEVVSSSASKAPR
ncbi:MAG TPA: prolyl oligopeptidase family serine peptidase [Thermoanaerobaculia bacterium]|nr:prolyl oligopeptidase family serine peptidase [Thermoanaerobaculia bacterium]